MLLGLANCHEDVILGAMGYGEAQHTTSVTDETVRVCIYARDDELRSWLLDELALMSWIGRLQLECVTTLDGVVADLVIIGADPLTADDRRAIDRKQWPGIAIGHADVIADRILGARLTSRELKQAIRELLVRP